LNQDEGPPLKATVADIVQEGCARRGTRKKGRPNSYPSQATHLAPGRIFKSERAGKGRGPHAKKALLR